MSNQISVLESLQNKHIIHFMNIEPHRVLSILSPSCLLWIQRLYLKKAEPSVNIHAGIQVPDRFLVQ